MREEKIKRLLPLRGFLIFIAGCTIFSATAAPDVLRHVDPFIGTGEGRTADFGVRSAANTFPGATAPFGMIQWSPDTSSLWYRFNDKTIRGFSLTHLSGPGCPNNEDLPVLPVVGPLTSSPGTDWTKYVAAYSHTGELATPGYYAVTLDDRQVRVELTTTQRSGLGRFTYPTSSNATLLINASHHASGMKNGSVEITGENELTGHVVGGNFCRSAGTFNIFYAIQFNRPFSGFGVWKGKELTAGLRTISGSPVGAYVTFDTATQNDVQMKVGLSYVSIENAKENLRVENPNWDFESVRQGTASAWNSLLGRVQVSGGTADEKKTFYTALYHVFQHPNVFSDVNGEYMGFDDVVHKADYVNYQNYSGWDVYRSWIQLVALIAPKETSDILKSMVDAGRQLGHLPKWTLANRETDVMVGDPGALIVANGYAFGARDFDKKSALEIMNRSGSETNGGLRRGLASYLQNKYLPYAPAVMLEYTNADFAIAQFAKSLGDNGLYSTYADRARYWRNSFNPQTGYIQPRDDDGAWVSPFDRSAGHGFVQGNAAQYTWMAPYDWQTLIDNLGSNRTAITRLDELFKELNAGRDRPYFYIGNQVQFATPWAYNFAAAPWRTQEVVRRTITEWFGPGPNGLPGNDDLGATSSWYAWAALGFYPPIPGMDVLALHGPLFPSVTIDRGAGKPIKVLGRDASGGAPYIQTLSVNGRPTTRNWLRFEEIADGGVLQFTMSEKPNKSWGSKAADVPPSFAHAGNNIALGKPATSSAVCDPQQGPEKAFDGSLLNLDNKWCSQDTAKWLQVDLGAKLPVTAVTLKHAGIRSSSSTGKWCSRGDNKWLQVDLGASLSLTAFYVKHAGGNGENFAWNTRDFNIKISQDAQAWKTVASVKGNTENRSRHEMPTAAARYVRLEIVTPTSTDDSTARIYELEVIDATGANVARNKAATADSSCGANENAEKAIDGDVEKAVAGDEGPELNTRDFTIEVSVNGVNWTKAAEIYGNTASQTTHPIPAIPARYVRLNVVTPTSNGSTAARIYEMEVVTGKQVRAPAKPRR